jgi:hypothetical protein
MKVPTRFEPVVNLKTAKAMCRVFEKRGMPANDLFEMYRAGDTDWSLRTRIGRGANCRINTNHWSDDHRKWP